MKVNFSGHHVPWLAELEHAIFVSAGTHGELDNAKDRVLKERGAEKGSFPAPPWFQLRVLSLGYLILVFPKEYWKRMDTDSTKKLKDVLNFKENVLKEKDPDLRKLRNAFAHADIALLENSFSYPNKKGSPSITVTFEELSIILHCLAAFYKELALPEKE